MHLHGGAVWFVFCCGFVLLYPVCAEVSSPPENALDPLPGVPLTGVHASSSITASQNTTGEMFCYSDADTGFQSQVTIDGRMVDKRIIGPGLPPEGWVGSSTLADVSDISATSLSLGDVPTMTWSYGCSPTAATMLFGYYDRTGYPNLYTGPTNGGIFPLTNGAWGSSPEGYGQCPLTASQYGLDGRTTNGHRNDYYYAYGSFVDPYYGSWTEHTPPDSIADFMGTNMYQKYSNSDSATTFWFNADSSPTYDFTEYDNTSRDGMHGMRLFAESRGYLVTTNYNQYIKGFLHGNSNGFTYDQYKAEIDAGYPVLIQLGSHTMLGIGYSGTNQVIVHDTWDYAAHTMTWGGYYGGMSGGPHIAVGVIHLQNPPPPLEAKFYGVPGTDVFPLTVRYYDASTGNPTSWNWSFGDGGNSTEQNPEHVYSAPGTFTVNLTVER